MKLDFLRGENLHHRRNFICKNEIFGSDNKNAPESFIIIKV